jgi:hypothetical protein
LSDLANGCEYFTIDKLCSAVSESQKGKANRQIRCQNDEKATCCYVCSFRPLCEIKCRFLGKIEGESPQTEAEKGGVDTAFNDKKTEVNQTENGSIVCCSECNAKMSRTRTIFRIDGWEKSHLKLVDGDSGKPIEELLPVTVYLCPRCGRIEFRANEK